MIAPATLRQRLILAAALALVVDFALELAGAKLLPANWQTLTLQQNSFIQPQACMAVVIGLLLGGWVGGRRFVPIGVALVLVVQGVTLAALVQLAHAAVPQRHLASILSPVLASNALGLGLQLLCAALGACAGAALHRIRPLFASPQEMP